MLLLFLILSIGFLLLPFLIIGIKNKERDYGKYDYSDYAAFAGIGAVIFIVSFIFFLSTLALYKNLDYNYQRIEILEEHNQIIELQVKEVARSYLDHESEIYGKLSETEVTTLFIVIPELNSSALLQREIDLYINNQDEIKQLKLAAINKPLYAWWLWFGNS